MDHLTALMSAYFDGQLTDQQFAEFSQWLAADSAHARRFALASFVHSRTCDFLRREDLCGLLFEDNEGNGAAIDPSHILSMLNEEAEVAARRAAEAAAEQARRDAEAAARRRQREEMLQRQVGRPAPIVIPRVVAYVCVSAAAAALLFVVFGLLPYDDMNSREGPSLAVTQPVIPPLEPVIVATITQSLDAKWTEVSQSAAADSPLVAGQFELLDGMVELTFDDEARMIVEAPVALELLSANRVLVNRGKVVAHVPSKAVGFTVLSGSAAIVDLGTEFGVEVGDDGATNVHVLDGDVVLVPGGDVGSDHSVMLPVGAARSVSADGKSIRDIVFDRSAFIREVPATRYELAVLTSRPLVFWRFNKHAGPTEVRSLGRLDLRAAVGAGVSLVAAGDQAPDEHRLAVSALGEHEGIAVDYAEQLAMTSNFTLEGWVMTSSAVNGPQRFISSFGASPNGGFALGIADQVWGGQPSTSSALLLFTFYNVCDATSTSPIVANEWTHVAATIDANGLPKLYLNGREVGVEVRGEDDTKFIPLTDGWRPRREGQVSKNSLYLGRHPPDADKTYPPEAWQGHFDGPAIYDRELSPEEIRRHYDAGKVAPDFSS